MRLLIPANTDVEAHTNTLHITNCIIISAALLHGVAVWSIVMCCMACSGAGAAGVSRPV